MRCPETDYNSNEEGQPMCGRFTMQTPVEQIAMIFDAAADGLGEIAPSYNVAPTQPVLTVVEEDGKRVLKQMRWGLVPVWAKDLSIGSRMINARAETLAEKNTFKRPFKSRRCLVVADGFFEWRKNNGAKTPMYIRLKSHKPFGFAGLYDIWKSPEGEAVASCTIITTEANDVLKAIHDRMPVVLAKRNYGEWLDPQNEQIEKLETLLVPYSGKDMEAYEVSRLVNKPDNNVPEVIEPMK